jgi:hypothetical protein
MAPGAGAAIPRPTCPAGPTRNSANLSLCGQQIRRCKLPNDCAARAGRYAARRNGCAWMGCRHTIPSVSTYTRQRGGRRKSRSPRPNRSAGADRHNGRAMLIVAAVITPHQRRTRHLLIGTSRLAASRTFQFLYAWSFSRIGRKATARLRNSAARQAQGGRAIARARSSNASAETQTRTACLRPYSSTSSTR